MKKKSWKTFNSNNKVELKNAFFNKIKEIEKNTILMRNSNNDKTETPKFSLKSQKISELISQAKFGCKEEKLIEIIELIINEKLPKNNNKIDEKYNRTICVAIKNDESEIISIVLNNEIYNFRGTFVSNFNLIRYANDDEIKILKMLIQNTILCTDIEDYLNDCYDGFAIEMIGQELVEEHLY